MGKFSNTTWLPSRISWGGMNNFFWTSPISMKSFNDVEVWIIFLTPYFHEIFFNDGGLFSFDQEFVYLCTKKFIRAVYQEILVFYYFKNSINRYPKMERMHILGGMNNFFLTMNVKPNI